MLAMGVWLELEAVRRFEFGTVFRDPHGDSEALLPASKVPSRLVLGDRMRLFVHLDSQHRPVLTDEEPPMVLGGVACLEVKAVRDQGAFLAWLSDRDLFLPFAEGPRIIRPGQKLWVELVWDDVSGRLMASNRLEKRFEDVADDLQVNDEVSLKVFRRTDLGWQALINDEYVGLLWEQDVFGRQDFSREITGWVKGIREDGKINLSLRPQGFLQVVEGDREVILDALAERGGFLDLHDKSDPEDVRRILNLSKKAFKKAVGGLWKEGLIEMDERGIRQV